jgi:LysR family transcriptional regulator, glycine cleavage system transcriptional activator
MTYLLPPLNPLRAFEAAGRHLSFTLAARELHVTPGAVGQQVKVLEDRLGVRLFERLHKQLS